MNTVVTEVMIALASIAGAMVLCFAFIMVALPFAKFAGLVDKPSARKRHTGNVPLVGGLCIFLTCLCFQLISPLNDFWILGVGSLILLVGMADDYSEIGPQYRLIVQCGAASLLVLGGGYSIVFLGALVSPDPIVLGGIAATVFSVFCVVGVINAINMIDGVDCLAGGVVAISLAGLIVASAIGVDNLPVDGSLLIMLGATLAFLAFNSGVVGVRLKTFLGDSGSMFLGIALAAYFIDMSQGADALISPVVAGWIFGLPLMDSVAVVVGRTMRGQSPLKAGRDHLHHLLLDKGLSKSACVGVMLTLHLTLVSIGVLGNYFELSMTTMFWAFVGLTIAHYAITPKALRQLESFIVRNPHRAQ